MKIQLDKKLISDVEKFRSGADIHMVNGFLGQYKGNCNLLTNYKEGLIKDNEYEQCLGYFVEAEKILRSFLVTKNIKESKLLIRGEV